MIVTSYRNVPDILHQCDHKGVRSAIVVSDGFGEIGPEGKKREKELIAIAASYGFRIIGPNTIDIFNAADAISAVLYDRGYEYDGTGGLSVITQTGMYGPQAMAWNEYHSGINKVIDLGNMSDIDETDCLEYLKEDDGTTVISMYIEHSRRPRELEGTAVRVSVKKPILCLKPGTSPVAPRRWHRTRAPWREAKICTAASSASRGSSGRRNMRTSGTARPPFSATPCRGGTASKSASSPGPSGFSVSTRRRSSGSPSER